MLPMARAADNVFFPFILYLFPLVLIYFLFFVGRTSTFLCGGRSSKYPSAGWWSFTSSAGLRWTFGYWWWWWWLMMMWSLQISSLAQTVRSLSIWRLLWWALSRHASHVSSILFIVFLSYLLKYGATKKLKKSCMGFSVALEQQRFSNPSSEGRERRCMFYPFSILAHNTPEPG